MTLASKLLDAGWREFKEGERFVAEKLLSLPGQSASTLRVESDSAEGLGTAVELRQSQLAGREDGQIKDVVTDSGHLVTDAQHTALKADGIAVPEDAEKVADPVPNEDEAKQAAPFDATAGSVDAPQVPADAADQGLSPEAVSASETGSGSADTSTDPSSQAQPATVPAPEGGALADAASDGAESQSTPSGDDVNATPAAVEAADAAGVDLAQVEGTGADGRVTKPDVEAAASSQE